MSSSRVEGSFRPRSTFPRPRKAANPIPLPTIHRHTAKFQRHVTRQRSLSRGNFSSQANWSCQIKRKRLEKRQRNGNQTNRRSSSSLHMRRVSSRTTKVSKKIKQSTMTKMIEAERHAHTISSLKCSKSTWTILNRRRRGGVMLKAVKTLTPIITLRQQHEQVPQRSHSMEVLSCCRAPRSTTSRRLELTDALSLREDSPLDLASKAKRIITISSP